MDNFYKEQISFDKIYFYGGIDNHDEFVEKINNKMKKFNLPRSTIKR